MGFLKGLFGSDDSDSVVYLPQTYSTTTVGAPNVTTDTTVTKEEAPKKAEMADTSEYDKAVKERRKKNGVRGSFTKAINEHSINSDSSGEGGTGAIGS